MNKTTKGYSLLEHQLFDECRAMAQYALSHGLSVPVSLMDTLRNYDEGQTQGVDNDPPFGASMEPDGGEHKTMAAAEAKHRLNPSPRDLIALHCCLAAIIKPVKPRMAVEIFAHANSRKLFKFLGSVPLIRHMMFISFLSLVGMFCVSVSPQVNGDPNHFMLLHNHGFSLWLNELFLLFAASIGASFNALFVADKYAREGVWNPAYETSYWIRYILGILSGAMLATLIPIEEFNKTANTVSINGFGAPMLALAGGFSSNTVYHILSRLTEVLESLVNGGYKEKIAISEKAGQARLAEQMARERITISARLSKLQARFGAGEVPDEFRLELESLQKDLLAARFSEEIPGEPEK